MMASNELFLLIKSLTKNEKRYFRMYARMQKGDKAYLRLFDEISQQKNYNEAKLKNKFSGERFIKQLSAAKNYLRKLVFKSLIMYYGKSSADYEITEEILKANILFKKALIPQYFKSLKRAEQLALKNERFGYLMEVYDMMRLIIRKEDFSKNEGKRIYNEAIKTAEKIKNIFDYSRLLNRTLNLSRVWGKSGNKTVEKEIDGILKSPIMKNESKALSARAKEIYFCILEITSSMRSNIKSEKKYLLHRLKLIEDNYLSFEGRIVNYRREVAESMIHNAAEIGNYSEMEKLLDSFRSKFSNPDNIGEVSDFSFYSSLILDMHTKSKNTEKAIEALPDIETGIEKYKHKIDITSEISLKFKIVKLLIMAGRYEESLKKLNTLINHPLLSVRKDIEYHCKLLNIIIHYEMGNEELLAYLLKSTYRYMYKRNRLYKLETLILNFIRKTLHTANKNSIAFHLNNLKIEMRKLKQDPDQKKAFEYFDFLEWAESKL